MSKPSPDRRKLVAAGAAATLTATFGWIIPARAQRPGARAAPTAQQPLGPFYPNPFPPDAGNDLTRVPGAAERARGEILFVSGSVFDVRGQPLAGVRVEIWQCNALGRYHHPRDGNAQPLDPGFRGAGANLTAEAGGYRFTTIKPVPYPGRTPHIHFRVSDSRAASFVTQMYVAGHPGNAVDALLGSIRDERARATVIAPVIRIAGTDEWTAKFDIVLPERT